MFGLISFTASISKAQLRRNSVLLRASHAGNVVKCESSINSGANVNSDENLVTPLSNACSQLHPECVLLLLSRGANVINSVNQLTYLAEVVGSRRYIPVDITIDAFNELIDRICECVRCLLTYDFNIDRKSVGDRSRTALMYSTWNVRITNTLLKAGADVNIVDIFNISTLHIAVSLRHVDVMVVLLDSGAYIDALDDHGRTPLHYACINLSQ